MHRTIKSLIGYSMEATDGKVGKVKDFYFDDQVWTIVYLMVKTAKWLSGRKVLISPAALVKGADRTGTFLIKLCREQIIERPDGDADKPGPAGAVQAHEDGAGTDVQMHLRSALAFTEYQIETSDGELGQLKDLIIDDETWHIEYLVIEMQNWLDGKKLLVPCRHIKEIQWNTSRIVLGISKAVQKNCHFYDETKLPSPKMAKAVR